LTGIHPTHIGAVIFDYGGVLCFHPTEDQIARAAAKCELEPSEFVRALWKNRIAYDAGQDPRDYWREVAQIAGRTFDEPLIAQMIDCEIDFWGRFDTRPLAWIEQLRSGGARTGILSNLPRPLGAHLRRRDGFLEHFDHVTFSFELGIVKPQRAIYEDAVRGLKVAPERALFLDDRPENIEGARAAGLHAELYTTWEEFVKETPARYGLPAPPAPDDVARRQ
jgi:putative hydrolase of the HAD superfamily